MIRQPPAAVPAAIVKAQRIFTHAGMAPKLGIRRKVNHSGKCSKRPAFVPVKRARVMMPIVFCASFVPCEWAMKAALRICNFPKTECTAPGVKRWKDAKRANITRAPRKNPASGDVTIGTTTLGQSPVSHFKTDQFPCPLAIAAPHKPPMSAWLELDGRPTSQVVMFHTKAAMSAHKTVAMVTTLVSTKPLPMVEATAPPRSAPVRLKTVAIAIACRGVSTLVETTVAMALAAS